MSINPKGNFKVYTAKVTSKEKYTDLVVSTSRKDKQNEGQYLYSTWYLRLVGDAHKTAFELGEKYDAGAKNESGYLAKKFPIVIKSFQMTNEPYEKDGIKVYKNLQLAVFDWGWPEEEGDEKPVKKASKPVEPPEDDNPF
jgi:hypothetical protein